MDSKTSKQDNDNSLNLWWWPGQWLRIVYSIWFDQLWYWKNVRPLLNNSKKKWHLFIQTILGATLISPVYLVIIGGIIHITTAHLELKLFMQGAIIGLLLGFLLGGITSIYKASTGLPLAATGSLAFSVFLSMFMSLQIIESQTLTIDIPLWFLFVFLPFWAISLGFGLSDGAPLDRTFIAFLALPGCLVFLMVENSGSRILTSIVFGSAVILGCSTSRYFITRQVPDQQDRQRLANPD